jgi:hypothetical protein
MRKQCMLGLDCQMHQDASARQWRSGWSLGQVCFLREKVVASRIEIGQLCTRRGALIVRRAA